MIFIIILAVVSNQLDNIASQKVQADARFALTQIANAATEVYQQGSGARKTIQVSFPVDVDEGSPRIINNTIALSVRGSDMSIQLDFPISGSLPNGSGSFSFEISSQGGSVTVGSLPFTITPSSLSFVQCALNLTTLYTNTITFTNNQNDNTSVDILVSWTNGTANLTAAPLNFTIILESTQDVLVDVDVTNDIVGFFSGELIANTTNYTTTVPISVDIISCGGGNLSSAVGSVVVTTYADYAQTITKDAFTPVENVTITATGFSPSTDVTLKIAKDGSQSVTGFPVTVGTNTTGGLTYVFNPFGQVSGSYEVEIKEGSTTAITDITLRGCG